MESEKKQNPVRNAWSRIKKISTDAIEKGRDFAGIAELRFKITMLERTNRTYFEDLGRLVYDLIEDKEKKIEAKTAVLAHVKRINENHEAISEIELEIKRIKAEFERYEQEDVEEPEDDEKIKE